MAEALPRAGTIGELRDAGHRDRTVKEELRENLLARLVTAGSRPWETPTLPLTFDPAGACGSETAGAHPGG